MSKKLKGPFDHHVSIIDKNYSARRIRDPAAHIVDNQYKMILEPTVCGTQEPLISTLIRGDYYSIPNANRVLDYRDMEPKGKARLQFPLKVYRPLEGTEGGPGTPQAIPTKGLPRPDSTQAKAHRRPESPLTAPTGRRSVDQEGAAVAAPSQGSSSAVPSRPATPDPSPKDSKKGKKTEASAVPTGEGRPYGILSESEWKVVKDIVAQRAQEGGETSSPTCLKYHGRRRYMSRPRDQDVILQ